MKKYRAAWWSERVAELASGGEVAAIAERYGVRERTLIWWRAELGRRSGGDTRLLPVAMSIRPQPGAGAGSSTLEVVVELGSARVTLHGAVSCEQLAALVAAARAC